MKKINEFLKGHKNAVVVACVVLIAVLLVVNSIIANNLLSPSDDGINKISATNPRYKEIMENGASALDQDSNPMAESTTSNSTPATKAETTAPESSASTQGTTGETGSTGTSGSIPFATAIAPAYPADYSEQWNLGYLIAIDNPDTTYRCSKVTLSDADRDLLERLCMGEFGSGGFIGASLIAQAVKDAMCFDGFTSVADVISGCHYTGSTSIGTNNECKQAVRYIFDDNRDAVQHRIMYMYNPYMVQSAFHESQNFILSYAGVRFFDRWGY